MLVNELREIRDNQLKKNMDKEVKSILNDFVDQYYEVILQNLNKSAKQGKSNVVIKILHDLNNNLLVDEENLLLNEIEDISLQFENENNPNIVPCTTINLYGSNFSADKIAYFTFELSKRFANEGLNVIGNVISDELIAILSVIGVKPDGDVFLQEIYKNNWGEINGELFELIISW